MKGLKQKKTRERERKALLAKAFVILLSLTDLSYIFDTPSIFRSSKFLSLLPLCVDYFSAFCSQIKEICRVEF